MVTDVFYPPTVSMQSKAEEKYILQRLRTLFVIGIRSFSLLIDCPASEMSTDRSRIRIGAGLGFSAGSEPDCNV